MSFDQLFKQLNEIQNNMHNFDVDTEWNKTVSGIIFARLQSMQKEFNATAHIEKKGSPHEIFGLGKEHANLYKVMRGGTVAEDGGTIHTYVESWEYKAYKWWSKAIDEARVPIDFLGTPIERLAQEASIPDFESYFVPSSVIQKYHLNPTGDVETKKEIERWILTQIKTVYNPLLKPDFELINYEGHLRLSPLTEDGRQSLTTDNSTYQKAKDTLRNGLAALQAKFQLLENRIDKVKSKPKPSS